MRVNKIPFPDANIGAIYIDIDGKFDTIEPYKDECKTEAKPYKWPERKDRLDKNEQGKIRETGPSDR